jgi:DNA-binding response OmpR family regulator
VARTVIRAGKDISLTGKEYALLEYLMRNKGRTITQTMIIEHVWDQDYEGLSNVVNVYINHLRDKVDRGFEQKVIHTIRGVGYKIEESNAV